LDFVVKQPKSSRPNISSKILSDPDLETVVELASLECYAQNIVGDTPIKRSALSLIGTANFLLRQAGPDPSHKLYSHAALLDADTRQAIMDRLEETMGRLRTVNLHVMIIDLEPDTFMEYLINNVRNAVISYQAFAFKKVEECKHNLEQKIKNLKNNYIENFELLSRLELELRNIYDIEICAELEKNSNFCNLNSERITTFFLKMARGSMQEKSINEIRDNNGRAFGSETEQRNFIFNHFANSF